jgi:pyruvate/2-oxoglutarate dehydrogenase complex dihydrolipoamide acyltransferase (E2) component
MAQTATVQIQMPEMGESVTEGIVLEWHVAEGDFVEEGDTVVEISTDKVDAEVPAPAAGTITKLLVEVDDEVPVGAPLAEMEPGEGPSAAPAGPVVGQGSSSSQAAGEEPSPAPPAEAEAGDKTEKPAAAKQAPATEAAKQAPVTPAESSEGKEGEGK